MATVQTTYPSVMLPPAPGTIEACDFGTRTGICEVAAGIGFGRAISQGSNEKGVVLGGTLAKFLGISVRDITLHGPAANPDAYPQYANVGYIQDGQIWVIAKAAVVADNPVYFDATTGELQPSGGSGPIVGARFIYNAAAGDRTIVELQAR